MSGKMVPPERLERRGRLSRGGLGQTEAPEIRAATGLRVVTGAAVLAQKHNATDASISHDI